MRYLDDKSGAWLAWHVKAGAAERRFAGRYASATMPLQNWSASPVSMS